MRWFLPFIIILTILFIIGCSGGGNPVVQDPINIPVKDTASSHIIWGLWQCTADRSSESLDIVQLRTGDAHLNAIQFLEPPPHVYLTVKNLKFTDNKIDCDVILKHPFLGLKQYTGFDVCGILIGSGSVTGFSNPCLRMAGQGDTRLLNPDGFTRWWNPSEFPYTETMFGYKDGLLGNPDSTADFNCTLNGYKLFCDDIADPNAPLTAMAPESRCVFSSGLQNVRHYTIEIGDAGFVFNYAVDANWKMPEGTPPWDVPDDFAPPANRTEAWNIIVTETSNTLWNDGSQSGGGLSLDITLWDHYDAGLNMLYLESPGNFDPVGPIEADVVSTYLAAYKANIISATPAQGSIDILITGQSQATGYQGILPGEPVSAYFIYNAEVGTGGENLPPVAQALIVTDPPLCPDDPIEFDASASYDPDGTIVGYEWDFNGDGTFGDPYDAGTDVNPTKIYTVPGLYQVNVRVTDDDGATDTLDEPLVTNIGGLTWVDDDAVEPYLGTFDQPYPTIQMGIDNASDECPGGGLVLVKDGTYEENIKMVSDITVEGYSTPAPLITTAEASPTYMVDFGYSDGSTLKHFRAQPRCTTHAIHIEYSEEGNTIDDIEFMDNPGGDTCTCAVWGHNWGTNNLTVNDVRVNGYHKPGPWFIAAQGNGVKVTNCTILNLTFTTASGMDVISVGNGDAGTLVAKNVIGHIAFSEAFPETMWVRAMGVEGSSGGAVRNNLIFDINNNLGNTGWTWGLDCQDASGMTIEHNTISGIKGPAWIYALETTDWNTDPIGTMHRDHIVTDLTAGMMNWRWAFLGWWSADLYVDYSCAYNVGNVYYDIESVKPGTGMTYDGPQFLNPTFDDFRVAQTSPCHNTAHDGTDMGAYGGDDPLTWLPD